MTESPAPFELKKDQTSFQNPTRLIFGDKTFHQLPALLKTYQPKRILLVTGEKSFQRSAYFPILKNYLVSYQIVSTIEVSQNPTQQFIQEQINRLHTKEFNLVIAVGGGSVLDTAKLLAVISRQEKTDLNLYLTRACLPQKKGAALIAIPTTAGTGSEVTPYASIETTDKMKASLEHSFYFSAIAIVDPELTYSMPEYVTACTGFDALSQGIESFWSVRATPESRIHALRAIELIGSHFEKLTHDPLNAEARRAMSLASCEAGLGIAQTKTTAVHSVSYPITTHFSVAHGHACALTLAEFVRFNAVVLKSDGNPMLAAFKSESYETMARKIEALMDRLKLERRLANLKIDEAGIKLILKDGFRADRISNNPRKVEVRDLESILNLIR